MENNNYDSLSRENLYTLLQVGSIINSSLKLENVLESVMNVANKLLNAEASSILLIDEYNNRLYFNTATGLKSEEIKHFTLKIGEGIAGWVAKEGKIANVPDVTKDDRFKKNISEKINFPTRNILCVPLTLHDRVIGSVEVINKVDGHSFSDEDMQILGTVANQSAIAIDNAKMHEDLNQENKNLKQILSLKHDIIGNSPPIKKIFEIIEKVRNNQSTLLIRGESGVGKELVAKTIHNNSPRAGQHFIIVNCSVLTETLLESELFGHEKGSFTGASARKIGRFEIANKGTIFLDEIGSLSQSTQIKLLRVLQEREFERVGGTETIKVDVRIMSATNENLEKAILDGRFREDLYYRLKVIEIYVPSLRERRDDIPPLAEFFLDLNSREIGRKVRKIDPKALTIMQNYDWPGNVRELKNIIERAVVLGSGDVLVPDHLPSEIYQPKTTIQTSLTSLDDIEKQHILNILNELKWNKSKTAKILKISRNRLDRKIKMFEITELS
ncbi:MAG: sigma-54-dependent Fis family transcriptional regulator [Candidatus Ancaeobacter aquaticus]|nr:sigma-54-dependent Fis family transcriptional regulator [Candidatus Ancaeobacter aquaticus]